MHGLSQLVHHHRQQPLRPSSSYSLCPFDGSDDEGNDGPAFERSSTVQLSLFPEWCCSASTLSQMIMAPSADTVAAAAVVAVAAAAPACGPCDSLGELLLLDMDLAATPHGQLSAPSSKEREIVKSGEDGTATSEANPALLSGHTPSATSCASPRHSLLFSASGHRIVSSLEAPAVRRCFYTSALQLPPRRRPSLLSGLEEDRHLSESATTTSVEVPAAVRGSDAEALAFLFPALHHGQIYLTHSAFIEHCRSDDHLFLCESQPLLTLECADAEEASTHDVSLEDLLLTEELSGAGVGCSVRDDVTGPLCGIELFLTTFHCLLADLLSDYHGADRRGTRGTVPAELPLYFFAAFHIAKHYTLLHRQSALEGDSRRGEAGSTEVEAETARPASADDVVAPPAASDGGGAYGAYVIWTSARSVSAFVRWVLTAATLPGGSPSSAVLGRVAARATLALVRRVREAQERESLRAALSDTPSPDEAATTSADAENDAPPVHQNDATAEPQKSTAAPGAALGHKRPRDSRADPRRSPAWEIVSPLKKPCIVLPDAADTCELLQALLSFTDC